MAAPSPTPDFAPVFAALKKILSAHAAACVVVNDTPQCYYLNSTQLHPRNKQPLCFGSVRTGKNYVSYHLMPVYASATLQAAISPALKKRMQGKACFNFTRVDDALFAELAELTRRGAAGFARFGFM
jgi:hypothetical protein